MKARKTPGAEDLLWRVETPDGREIVIDFSEFDGIPDKLLSDLVYSFKGVSGGWEYSSKKTNKRYFCDLLQFLQKFDWKNSKLLLIRFEEWVRRSKKHTRAKTSVYLAVKIVGFLADGSDSLWSSVLIPHFEREPRSNSIKIRESLDVEHVRQIVDVCRQKVDEMMSRYELACYLVYEGGVPRNQEELLLQNRLVALLDAGGGYLPTRVQAVKGARKLIKDKSFGIRDLKSYLFPMFRDLLPFYLLLLHETAGNPTSVLWAEVDCLIVNPVDPEQTSFNVKKNRGGEIQRKWFGSKKEYEPPVLVKKILKITSKTREYSGNFSKFLFVTIGHSRKVVKVPDYGTVHLALNDFIKNNNLKDFDPVDFRRFAANQIMVQHRDPALLQATLQHRSIRTTRRYVDRNKIAKEVAEVVSAGQAKILSKLEYSSQTSNSRKNEERDNEAMTVFGFHCKDPFAGVAPGSRKGIACEQFGKCGACNNAVVLIDSPEHMARVLQARDCLKRAERGALVDSEKMLRFKALYQQTLRIIEQVFLPKIAPPILARAIKIVSKLPPMLDIEL